MSSINCSALHSPASAAHKSSAIVAPSCSASLSRMSSASCAVHTGSSASAVAVAATTVSVSPTRAAKKATWTPHSYSAPQRAVVRRMTSSRSRRSMLPRSSRLPARNFSSTRGLWARVRKSAIGSRPGGIIAAKVAASGGS